MVVSPDGQSLPPRGRGRQWQGCERHVLLPAVQVPVLEAAAVTGLGNEIFTTCSAGSSKYFTLAGSTRYSRPINCGDRIPEPVTNS